MPLPAAIVLHGATSAGKSSLAAALQDAAAVPACRPTYFVSVRAPLAVLEARERGRTDRAAGMARAQIDHPAYLRHHDLVIDTSVCSATEGAALVRRYVAEYLRSSSDGPGALAVAGPA